MVIRTPYGLTEIKACENNAFYFWMALIFWYNRPTWWHFSRHFIHLVAWLFYICSDYRSEKSHSYSFLSLDDFNSFFTEKIEAMRGNLCVLLHQNSPSLCICAHIVCLSLLLKMNCPAPMLVQLLFPCSAPLIPSCSFQASPATITLLFLISKHKLFSCLWIYFLWLFPFFHLDKTPWKSCLYLL